MSEYEIQDAALESAAPDDADDLGDAKKSIDPICLP